jgi:hypothetical protein
MFDSKSIKAFKNKVILLTYRINGYTHSQSGTFQEFTKECVIFAIEEHKIPLTYAQIIEIEEIQVKKVK